MLHGIEKFSWRLVLFSTVVLPVFHVYEEQIRSLHPMVETMVTSGWNAIPSFINENTRIP